MSDHLYEKFKRLTSDEKAELAVGVLLSKGLISADDIREALKPAMHCKLCDFITEVSETTEQAERLMMDHMRVEHPEYVGRVSEFFVNRGEARLLEEGL